MPNQPQDAPHTITQAIHTTDITAQNQDAPHHSLTTLDPVDQLHTNLQEAKQTVQDCLLNTLQASQPLSNAMLSAATRATMAKRALAQLEALKANVDLSHDLSQLVLERTKTARLELEAAARARMLALERAEAAEISQRRAEASATAREADADATIARAEGEMSAAAAREAAERTRAEEAEASLAEARDACASAAATEATAVANESKLAEQLERERAVLARLAAENLLFVKKLQQVELERDRAERDRAELQTHWREQTEEWFRKATDELQGQLLTDWGSSHGILANLQAVRDELAAQAEAHAAELEAVRARAAEAIAAEEGLVAERDAARAEHLAGREERGRLRAEAQQLRHERQVAAAQLEATQLQAMELKDGGAAMRKQSEEASAALFESRDQLLKLRHEHTRLTADASATAEKLRLANLVSERSRNEVNAEHAARLEADARQQLTAEENALLKEHVAALQREKRILLESVEKRSGSLSTVETAI